MTRQLAALDVQRLGSCHGLYQVWRRTVCLPRRSGESALWKADRGSSEYSDSICPSSSVLRLRPLCRDVMPARRRGKDTSVSCDPHGSERGPKERERDCTYRWLGAEVGRSGCGQRRRWQGARPSLYLWCADASPCAWAGPSPAAVASRAVKTARSKGLRDGGLRGFFKAPSRDLALHSPVDPKVARSILQKRSSPCSVSSTGLDWRVASGDRVGSTRQRVRRG